MPSSVVVSIEIKPHLKKYLIEKSENKAEPVIFPRKHPYNISLNSKVVNLNKLKSMPVNERSNVTRYFYSSNLSEGCVHIQLRYNDKKNVMYYNYLSMRSKTAFRAEVQDDFYHELKQFVVKKENIGISRMDAIMMFMRDYMITDDDIEIESLYRQITRIKSKYLTKNYVS